MLVDLMMAVYVRASGELVQVWSPDQQLTSMENCKRTAELMLKIPLVPERTALAICSDPTTGEIWTKWYVAP